MKTLHCIIPAVVLSALIYTSCEPFEHVSDIPEIHFKSFTRYQIYTISSTDTTITEAGEMVFSFIDGDADFGVDLTSNPTDTINFVLTPFQKTDGVYDPIDADVYGRKYTIQNDERLERTGQNKTIKGDIKVAISYPIIPPFDTIRYDFYILDRAGNKSNIESSSDIGFHH